MAVFSKVRWLTVFLIWLPVCSLGAPDTRLLVIHSYHDHFAWTRQIDEAIQERIGRSHLDAEIHTVYLDLKRLPDGRQLPAITEQIRVVTGGSPPAAVITSDDAALHYALGMREELFPGVPVFFCGIDHIAGMELFERHPLVTGVCESINLRATLQLALDLVPDARSIAILTDLTETGLGNRAALEAIESDFPDLLFDYAPPLSRDRVPAWVQSRPEGTIGIWAHFQQDAQGRFLELEESVRLMTDTADYPVFSCWEFAVSYGADGGVVATGESQGTAVANLVVQHLGSPGGAALPPPLRPQHLTMIDAEAAEQFAFRESGIPAGAILLNAPPPVAASYPWLTRALLLALVVLGGGIVLLVAAAFWRNRLLRRVTLAERRLRNAAAGAGAALWELDLTTGKMVWTDDVKRVMGVSAAELSTREQARSFIHEDDREAAYEALEEHIAGNTPQFDHDFRMRDRRGKYRWFSIRGEAFRDVSGKATHVAGIAIDITERLRTYERLRLTERIFESITSGILICDATRPDLPVLDVNPALERMTGYKAPDLVEKAWTLFEEGQHRQPGLEELRSVMSQGTKGRATIRSYRRDGSMFWNDIYLSPVHNETGKVTHYVAIQNDVTPMIDFQERLRRERDFLSTVMESAPGAIMVADLKGRLTLTNTRAREILHIDEPELPSPEEMERRITICDHTGRELPKEEWLANQVIRTGRIVRGRRQTIRHIDGASNDLIVDALPLRSQDGTVTGVVLGFEDVTEETVRQRELAESEQRFRFFADFLPHIVWLADEKGLIQLFNQTALDMFGITEAEVPTFNWLEMTHADDRARVARQYGDSMKARSPYITDVRVYDIRRREYRWHSAQAIPQTSGDGRTVRWYGIANDIHDLRVAEENLRRSEERLRLATSAAGIGAWEWDIPARRWTAEESWLHRQGIDPADVGEDELSWRRRIHAEDMRNIRRTGRELLTGRIQSFTLRARFLLGAGDMRWLLLAGRVVEYSPSGSPRRAAGVLQDITDQVRAETDNRRLQERMEKMTRFESLAVLAGGIAHDFNNILVGIMGEAGLLRYEVPQKSQALPTIDRIEEAAEEASRLTQQLLIYAGRGRLSVETANLGDLLRQMSPLLNSLTSRNAALKIGETVCCSEVEADLTQIRQVIMNLVVNASEAIGSSQGTITVNCFDEEVDADRLNRALRSDETRPGSFVVVRITDTGCGMDARTLDRVFDPFFTTKEHGHGLGLASCLGIVQRHRGFLEVESVLGAGSTFTIGLPAADASVGRRHNLTPLPGDGMGMRILVVDDEPIVLKATARMLEQMGLEVLTAKDGTEGLAVFDENRRSLDLALLDITMPGLSGIELRRKIRDRQPRFPVLLMSGYSVKVWQEEVGDDSIDHRYFLQKPFTHEQLVSLLSAMLPGLGTP